MKLRVIVSTLLLTVSGCASSDKAKSGTPTILASFFPVQELVEGVADPSWEVMTLTSPGVEPHDLELSPSQVVAIQEADLVVYIGGGFQPALEDALEQRKGPKLDLLTSTRDLLPLGGHENEHAITDGHENENPTERDPHVWLDPGRYAEWVTAIEEELAQLDGYSNSEISSRGGKLRKTIEQLDKDYEKGLSNCESRTLVTAHAAFSYLADSYGLEAHAVTGFSPESEPGPDQLAEVAAIVKSENITTVFTETLVPADLAEAVARETGATTAVLNPVEGLTKEQERAGAGYVSLMDENLKALRAGLRCS